MIVLGAVIVVAGLGRTWSSWSDHRARKRALAAARDAREIGEGAAPGEIVCVEGKVTGGAAAGASAEGVALYGHHLILEDARGRRIGVGGPGRREVAYSFRIGEAVFAVGELASPEGGPYRRTSGDVITGGRSRTFWVALGDRRAVIHELEGSFVHGGPFEGLLIMAAGLLIAGAGLLIGP